MDKGVRGRSQSCVAKTPYQSGTNIRSYAHAVRNGSKPRQEGGQQRIVFSYEAANEDLARLKKAF
ncbi:hypothetical protein A2U01_0093230, partial [Trifolium medium]|nr:hypothetical protein [Trifolium medium]